MCGIPVSNKNLYTYVWINKNCTECWLYKKTALWKYLLILKKLLLTVLVHIHCIHCINIHLLLVLWLKCDLPFCVFTLLSYICPAHHNTSSGFHLQARCPMIFREATYDARVRPECICGPLANQSKWNLDRRTEGFATQVYPVHEAQARRQGLLSSYWSASSCTSADVVADNFVTVYTGMELIFVFACGCEIHLDQTLS